MRYLAKLFDIESMSEDALAELYVMAQGEADRQDRLGNAKGCLKYSELWCDIEELSEARYKAEQNYGLNTGKAYDGQPTIW
jgi:hypothetical protein